MPRRSEVVPHRRRSIALALSVVLHVGVLLLLTRGRAAAPTDTSALVGAAALRFQLVSVTAPVPPVAKAITPSLAFATAEPVPEVPRDAPSDAAQTAPAQAASGDADCRHPGDGLDGLAVVPWPTSAIAATPTAEAFVELTFHVDADGQALREGIAISRSSGITALDEASIAYVATHAVSKPLCEGQLGAQRMRFRLIYRDFP